MFRRKKKATEVFQRQVSEGTSKAAETVGDVAERAATMAGQATERAALVAKVASKSATPALRGAAHTAAGTLSEAAERAAEILATAADRLASADASTAARERIAERAEALAAAIRPRRRKRHLFKKALFVSVIAGGVVALVKSPLKSKLADRLFGPPPSYEPEAITLPSSTTATTPQEDAKKETRPVKAATGEGAGSSEEKRSTA
jgi:hypothetical protein